MKIVYDQLEFDFYQNGKILHFGDNSLSKRQTLYENLNGLGSKGSKHNRYEVTCFHDKKLVKKVEVRHNEPQKIKILLSLDLLLDVISSFNPTDKMDWSFTLKFKNECIIQRKYFDSLVPKNYPLYGNYAQIVFDYTSALEIMPIKKWH